MDHHRCETIIVTCIDFRFQKYIDCWIKENFGEGNHDRVAIAGGVKDQEEILKQVEISKKLHHIKKVVLINHEDCGVYGAEGTAEKYAQDLKDPKQKILSQFPDLEIDLYYLHLDGTFEELFRSGNVCYFI